MSDFVDFKESSNASRSGRLDISPVRALELLNELRDRVAEGVASSFAQNLKQAKGDMVQLAQRASEPQRKELYSSGHTLLTNGGMGLLQRFRDVYITECDQTLARLSGHEGDAWDNVGELSLVDSNEFERDLAVGRLSAKAAYHCSEQITALDRRVAALLDLKRMDSDGSPFALKRVFTSFVKAAEASWAGEQLSLILLETFEHYTAGELPKVYRGLNQYLVEQGVLEKLPVELEEREQDLERRTRVGDLDGNIGDIFAQLASGLMGGGRHDRSAGDDGDDGFGGPFFPGGPGGVGGGNGGLGGGTGRTPGAGRDVGQSPSGLPRSSVMGGAGSDRESDQMGPMVFGQFFEGLNGLQHGSGQAAAQLGVELGDFDPTNSAMLRSLSASPRLRWLQPNDAMTIELIAMLFDCIFSDTDIPDGLRSELGRLQVPILKVALMNKGFFSDQRHPARRLMDVIAGAVRGWGPDDEAALLEQIRDAVTHVLNGFDTDTEVFSAQIEKLEKILSAADRRARDNVSDLVRRLEQRDRKVVAETLVKDQIARRLPKQALPTPVQGFIDNVWRDLLTRLYIKAGDKAEVWQQALGTLDDLIWSVQPKTLPEERHRLMGMLPALLRRLPEGMALIGKQQDWDPFLQVLMKLHMEAIRPPAQPQPRSQSVSEPQTGPEATATPTEQATAPDAIDSGRAFDSEATADPARQTTTGTIEPDAALIAGLTAGLNEAKNTDEHGDGAPTGETRDLGDGAGLRAGEQRIDLPGADPDDEPEDEFMAAAKRIELGDWVEFSNIGPGSLTLRASWMSRLNGLILFADRQGRNAEILTLERIAKLLRKANARVLSRDPLTDRAVAKLLVTATPKELAPS